VKKNENCYVVYSNSEMKCKKTEKEREKRNGKRRKKNVFYRPRLLKFACPGGPEGGASQKIFYMRKVWVKKLPKGEHFLPKPHN
jgi:hypothetical protein